MNRSSKKRVKIVPQSFLRKAVSASASVTGSKNTIHFITEVDVTKAMACLEELKKAGTPVSVTSFLTKAFAQTVTKYRWMNSFIARGKQIFLEDIIISILMEREIEGVSVPEPMVIHDVERKTPLEIGEEIKSAQSRSEQGNSLGDLSKARYLNFIPPWLLKTFVRLADRNINMGIKYGKLAITSVGMFSSKPLWVVPHGSATILLSVGTITADRQEEGRRILHLTASFDHDVIDGAPAARFMEDLCNEMESASCLSPGAHLPEGV
ncbi:MAG: 2-oxo acid dehydrogenase subunit E2 [Spirochaetales bacterium]|nr:2-oxo acid dehydrogenase subunit E2 [Spirochaetales bacterium]